MSKGEIPTVGWTVREELFFKAKSAVFYGHRFGSKLFAECIVHQKFGYWIIKEDRNVTVIPENEVTWISLEGA